MLEVFQEAVSPVNLPLTIVLGALIGYWLLVMVGMFDLGGDSPEMLDGQEVFGGWFSSLANFLNVGEVPSMLVATLLVMSLWTISMVMNHYLNDGSLALAALLLIPNLAVSLYITHLVTKPFRALFRKLNHQGEEHLPLIGRTCVIATSEVNDHFGQAIIETKGAPLLIHARTADGSVLRKGDTALIINKDLEKHTFTVIKVTEAKLED
jgi:hypothetical protein